MTTVKDILNFTETFAPISTAADFDNCGVLVGDKDAQVTKVLVALDITTAVAEEANNIGADLIISHHPVIFNPLKRLTADSVPYLLAKYCISALCLHTNLDITEDDGVNLCLAKALSLSDIRIFPEEFVCLGELSAPMETKDFAQLVKDTLKADSVFYTEGNKPIKTVGMCSGAGGDMYHSAIALGADVFLTGEAKHHEYLDAVETGIPMVTAGHFFTEDIAMLPLKNKLAEAFPQVEFVISSASKNPYSCI